MLSFLSANYKRKHSASINKILFHTASATLAATDEIIYKKTDVTEKALIGRNKMTSLILVTILACSGCGTDPTPTAIPAKQPDTPEQVAKILSDLEEAGQKVETIRCSVLYSVEDNLNLSSSIKTGSLVFKRSKPHPMVLVEFTKTVSDDIVYRNKEWWLFRDRWLTEAKAKSKTIIKREWLRANEECDFFDLETSRMPMPFGQKKEQILQNFEVKLMPPQVGDPENSDHLLCRPKKNAPLASEYKRLEYYVSKELHLPTRIVAEDVTGNKVTVVDFTDTKKGNINSTIPDSAFVLPKETRGFHVTEEPLKPESSPPTPGK